MKQTSTGLEFSGTGHTCTTRTGISTTDIESANIEESNKGKGEKYASFIGAQSSRSSKTALGP